MVDLTKIERLQPPSGREIVALRKGKHEPGRLCPHPHVGVPARSSSGSGGKAPARNGPHDCWQSSKAKVCSDPGIGSSVPVRAGAWQLAAVERDQGTPSTGPNTTRSERSIASVCRQRPGRVRSMNLAGTPSQQREGGLLAALDGSQRQFPVSPVLRSCAVCGVQAQRFHDVPRRFLGFNVAAKQLFSVTLMEIENHP